MDFFSKFRIIEETEPVETVMVENNQLWPIIRVKVFEELRDKYGVKSRKVKLNANNLKILFKSLFFGLFNIFKLFNSDYWVFSASDRRKMFQGKNHDRIIEDIFDINEKSIIIENPLPRGSHYQLNTLPNKRVINQTFFYLITFLISKTIKPRIQNENVLKEALESLNIKVDYIQIYKIFKAQSVLISFLLKFKKPKVVLMVYTASSFGYIKAFKEHKIPVIELQHGIINSKHIAYNLFKDFNTKIFPDYLFTFSNSEKCLFENTNYFLNREKFIPVGYSYLDKVVKINTEFQRCKKAYYKEKFDKIVAFSFQEPFGEYSLDFLTSCANLDPNVLILLILRSPNYKIPYTLPKNIILPTDLSMYDALQICDIHSTINSTTTIEAFSFGKPSILINYKNQAEEYFSHLQKENELVIISKPEDFIKYVRLGYWETTSKLIKTGEKFFKSNFKNNLKEELIKLGL